jgi:hypothetical protein
MQAAAPVWVDRKDGAWAAAAGRLIAPKPRIVEKDMR